MEDKKITKRSMRERAHDFIKNFSIEYLDDDIVLVAGIELKENTDSIKTPRNAFYFCHKGSIVIETAEAEYTVHAGETFICPTGTYMRLKHLDPDAVFSALGLTDRILQSLLNTNMHIWNNIVYVLKERVAKPSSGEDSEHERIMGWHFSEMMSALIQMKTHPFRKQMIYLLLQTGLMGFCGRYKESATKVRTVEPLDNGASQAQIIFTKFMELVQNEPIKHQPVYYYAEKLCISSKYLSYVCKQISGKSASEFIQSAVLGEIIHYLESTTLSVKEISCRMGFPNISFFGKYVKTYLGMSPNKYRK